ncbi:MAG: ComF family protein [Acidobacteria bacterium]|nr:ComF family protein [Acidobacteriota bacterium]
MYLPKAIAGLRDATLAMLYPTACRVCGAMIESWRDGVACAKCWEEVQQTRWPEDFCTKCGLPLQPLPSQVQIEKRRCGRCDEMAFNYARACGPYEGALRESVLWLKTHPQISQRMRELLIATFFASPELQASESIIPVPLHPGRLAERTFNQAEIIAYALSSASGLRVDTASLARVKKTEMHRAGMGARERARTLEKAFHLRAPRLIENRVVLVVDDVMTTSRTAQEIAQTLIKGGASVVNVLTLARAVSMLVQ